MENEDNQANQPDTTEVHQEQLIDDEDKQNPKYHCFKCQDLMNSPHETTCCEENFCQQCIEKSLNQASWLLPRCPNPKCKKRRFKYYKNAYARRDIDKLAITCKHKHKHCDWKGIVGEHEKHLLDECNYHLLPCPFVGCDFTTIKSQMNAHIEQHIMPHAKYKEYEGQLSQQKRKNEFLSICGLFFLLVVVIYVSVAFATGKFRSSRVTKGCVNFGNPPYTQTLCFSEDSSRLLLTIYQDLEVKSDEGGKCTVIHDGNDDDNGQIIPPQGKKKTTEFVLPKGIRGVLLKILSVVLGSPKAWATCTEI